MEESENLGSRKTWATWSAATNLGVPSDLEQKWANHHKRMGVIWKADNNSDSLNIICDINWEQQ